MNFKNFVAGLVDRVSAKSTKRDLLGPYCRLSPKEWWVLAGRAAAALVPGVGGAVAVALEPLGRDNATQALPDKLADLPADRLVAATAFDPNTGEFEATGFSGVTDSGAGDFTFHFVETPDEPYLAFAKSTPFASTAIEKVGSGVRVKVLDTEHRGQIDGPVELFVFKV